MNKELIYCSSGCHMCGKKHNVKKVITDQVLVSYICDRCNRKHSKMVQKLSHSMRANGTANLW